MVSSTGGSVEVGLCECIIATVTVPSRAGSEGPVTCASDAQSNPSQRLPVWCPLVDILPSVWRNDGMKNTLLKFAMCLTHRYNEHVASFN